MILELTMREISILKLSLNRFAVQEYEKASSCGEIDSAKHFLKNCDHAKLLEMKIEQIQLKSIRSAKARE